MSLNNICNLGIFGDGVWCHKLIFLIHRDPSIKINFICGRNKIDQKLKSISNKLSIPFISPNRVDSKKNINFFNKFDLDFCFSMSYDQIFSKNLIKIFNNKIFNCHAGLLPSYRGRSVLNWALINGEKYYGVTVHKVDKSIDTGDILLQKKIKIKKNWEFKHILGSAYEQCSDLGYIAIKKLQNGRYRLTKQIHSKIKPYHLMDFGQVH